MFEEKYKSEDYMEQADQIYFNGTILTMDNEASEVEALVVGGDKILFAGKMEEALKYKNDTTLMTDLKNATMLPGFFDPHGHFITSGYLYSTHIDLSPPPHGKVRKIDDIKQLLAEKVKTVKKGEWICAYGYDDTLLEEQRHPLKEDIDEICPDNPVVLRHISANLCSFNSLALKIANITKDTPNPQGGVYRRDKDGEPNGVAEGWRAFFPITNHMPPILDEDWDKAAEVASQVYNASGVTSAQEGFLNNPVYLEKLLGVHQRGKLTARVQIYPAMGIIDLAQFNDDRSGSQMTEDNMIGLGPIKVYSDASIQGYTGFLSNPYHKVLYDMEDKENYRGYLLTEHEILTQGIINLHKAGWNVGVHANGDEAIDIVINAIEEAQKQAPREDARHVIIHCQMAREDQLDRIEKLGIIPSFFVAHVYYWGDRHRDIFLGEERAARLNPCKSALDRNITFTLHNDTAITPIDPLLLVWTAVNRVTTSGKVLGKEQCIPVLEALRGVTSWAAYQANEDNIKGSLEKGKLADMVILEENPLKVDSMHIKDIKIKTTILSNKVVYGELPE